MKPRSLIRDLLQQPRRLWIRKAIFQVHLWVGLAMLLYLILISLSGAVLVFKDEIVRAQLPPGLRAMASGPQASPATVLERLRTDRPGAVVDTLQFPSALLPAFSLVGKDADDQAASWMADPITGVAQPASQSWIDWLLDLHYYLLLPRSWGMQANGVGAVALLVLAASGLVLWWPGTRVWTRGLRVNLRASWRRINYDLHSAIGFWTLAIVCWWAFSGVYFAWYRPVTAAIAAVSPIVGIKSPEAVPAEPEHDKTSLDLVLATAQRASPGGHLWSVSNVQLTSPDSFVLLDRGAPGDFSHRDIVRVRRDGRLLSVWHYGERHTLADWLLWSMHPLHFGTLWGPWLKLLWSALGILLAALSVTGSILYWNRFLRHAWPGKAAARHR